MESLCKSTKGVRIGSWRFGIQHGKGESRVRSQAWRRDREGDGGGCWRWCGFCRCHPISRRGGRSCQEVGTSPVQVKSYCGHGIGELFHCAPNTPHYGRNKAVGVMKAGQTFTIEPMINAGVWRDRMWPDGWTAVTADGKRSAQFEHTLLVCNYASEKVGGK